MDQLRKQQEAAARIAQREQALQDLQARYASLPPPPPPLPSPTYTSLNPPSLQASAATAAFFTSCATGDLSAVLQSLAAISLSPSDLSFALEEACQNLQVDVTRCLLEEAHIQLHHRCFYRENPYSSPSSQNIFTSGSPQLFDLLKVFLFSGGWHPDQLLSTPQKGFGGFPPSCIQDVALHYPRCLSDEAILGILLDAGANPTIARVKLPVLGLKEEEVPTERLSGYILEMALNWGSPAGVDMLLSHGARLKQGAALHSLARRCSSSNMTTGSPNGVEASRATPDTAYPRSDTARLIMAKHVLVLGEDINALKNIYHIVCLWSVMPLPYTYNTTPLSHAVGCMDWTFARWLLQNGADPTQHPNRWDRDEMVYNIPSKVAMIKETVRGLLKEVGKGGLPEQTYRPSFSDPARYRLQ